MFKRILVPIDGTPRSQRAVKYAVDIARVHGGSLVLYHMSPSYHPPYVVDPYSAVQWLPEAQYLGEAKAESAKLLAKAKKLATAKRVTAKVVHAFGDAPAKAILAAARKARADSIVMASHGRRGLEKLFLGSETQKVLGKTTLPVLVVR